MFALHRRIISYHQSGSGWVADLDCGHLMTVREVHPAWGKPWIEVPEGRAVHLGCRRDCMKCDDYRLSY